MTRTVVAMSLQCPQSPVHECPLMSNQQDQAEVKSHITKQNGSTEEKPTEEKSKSLKNVTVKECEAQESPTVTCVSSASDLEGLTEHTDNGLQFQTCTNQPKILLPTSEDGDDSPAIISEEQLRTEDSQCNLERNCETKQGDPCNTHLSDIKEITKKTVSGLPARKKRRMGTCGLTERERSQILTEQSAAESVENEMSKNISNDVAQDEIVSSVFIAPSTSLASADYVTEQGVAEIKSQSSHSGKNDRTETEVQNTVTTSEGSSFVCYPGSEGKSCEAEGATELGPEQPDETKSDQESTTEIMTKTSDSQRKDGEEKFTDADCNAAISFNNCPTQNDETGEKDEHESLSLLVNKTRAEGEVVDVIDGTEAKGTSSTVTKPSELCEAAVTPTGTELKDRNYCEEESSPLTVNAVHTEMRDIPDPFGSGCLDYVSDSQLNTVVLIEEEVMESKRHPHSADCNKDATDLICGLIRELSSLNHKVMATHRELENLRRGGKTLRSSPS